MSIPIFWGKRREILSSAEFAKRVMTAKRVQIVRAIKVLCLLFLENWLSYFIQIGTSNIIFWEIIRTTECQLNLLRQC